MRWLLKLPFNQNHHLINHMHNSNFKCHIIFLWTLDVHVELLDGSSPLLIEMEERIGEI
jgi:hypothetical protein